MSYRPLIEAAQDFFAQLAENNSRDWFLARKAQYDTTIAAPAKAFAEAIEIGLTEMIGRPYRTKLFRIHRDVRFSKDKSPYKTHLHMSFADAQEAEKQNKFDQQNDTPSFFCGIDPGRMTIAEDDFAIKPPSFWIMVGFLGFDKGRLAKYRAFIDTHGDDLKAKMDTAGAVDSSFGAGAYKRVPKPYPGDHRHEALLRRKSFVAGRDLQGEFEDGGEPLELVRQQISKMLDMAAFVQHHLVP